MRTLACNCYSEPECKNKTAIHRTAALYFRMIPRWLYSGSSSFISIRRFRALPCGVLLGTAGLSMP